MATKEVILYESLESVIDAVELATTNANTATTNANNAAIAANEAVTEIENTFNIVNVKNFGAVGDGSEATAAFVAAEAALPAGGGTIYVPDGIYTVAFRLKKSNVIILGQSWNTVLKARSGYTQLIDDCPLRIFGNYCQVRNLKVDGNREGNPQVTNSAQAREADGIAIYSDYNVVENCHVTNCHGHHIIVWNDFFEDEDWPTAARKYNSTRFCLITVPGFRNPFDYASTKDLGDNYDENINHNNDMISNILIGCQLTIHTGWDTRIIGNTVIGAGITMHSNSRRCVFENNIIDGGNITLRGPLAGALSDTNRRSQDTVLRNNIVRNSDSAGVALLYLDGGIIEGNQIFNSTVDGLQLNSVTGMHIKNNIIKVTGGRGIQQSATSEGVANTLDKLNISGNEITGHVNFGMDATGIMTDSIFENNKIIGGSTAIQISNAGSGLLNISGNIIEDTAGSSMNIRAVDSLIKNNTIRDCGSNAILADSNDLTIEGNYVNGCDRYLSYPVDATTGGIVRFNVFKNASVEPVRRLPATEYVFANIGLTDQIPS